MSKKHIFIWQSGEPLHIDKEDHNPMRAISLSEYFLNKKFKVTLISSNYNHTYKKFRLKKIKRFKKLKLKPNFNLILINSSGYKKNISIQRLLDHFILAFNLHHFLKNHKEKIDFAIIGFPPIEPSIVFSNWLVKNKIPYLVDIKDLWPEYFYERVKNKFLSFFIRSIFFLHDILLKKTLKNSFSITANNNFFLKYIKKKINRKKNIFDQVIYLTKPLINYESSSFIKKINFDKKKFNIYFCGRIDLNVFDFITVLKALKILKKDKIKFHFYLGGYGELDKLRNLINKNNLKDKVSILGFVNKYRHSILLKKTDLFIAPFFNNLNFSSNLSNKFIESIQYNLPILTPLKKDIAKFILKNNIGDIYKEKNHINLAQKIKDLIIKLEQSNLIKKNIIKLSDTEFNHENNYSKFLRIINNC